MICGSFWMKSLLLPWWIFTMDNACELNVKSGIQTLEVIQDFKNE